MSDSLDKQFLIGSRDGDLFFENGELQLDARADDPVGVRMGGRGRSIGKLSGDSLRPDGKRDELTLDQFKRDERYYGRGDRLVGEKTVHLRAPGQSGADTLISTVRFDGVTYHVPIIAAAGIGSSGSVQGPRVLHEDGAYVTTYQADGNIVTRRADANGQPIEGAVVWSSFGGPV